MHFIFFVIVLNKFFFYLLCRLWQEKVHEFFSTKPLERSWSLVLELKVCLLCAIELPDHVFCNLFFTLPSLIGSYMLFQVSSTYFTCKHC